MSLGPGKYDDLCTYVRAQAEAHAAIVIVLAGKDGSGFSCQADVGLLINMPALLRHIAWELEQDAQEATN